MSTFNLDLPNNAQDFRSAMLVLLDEHRPSRMPFFRRVASLPFRIASDPDLLGEIYLVYQAAMHATRAAAYYLPYLDSPALRKRKLRILMDYDGLPGDDTHHYQLARAFLNIGAHLPLADEEFGSHEDLCRHLDQETAHFVHLAQRLYCRSLGPWCAVEMLSVDWMRALAEDTFRPGQFEFDPSRMFNPPYKIETPGIPDFPDGRPQTANKPQPGGGKMKRMLEAIA
jgi:hypothetical protein